MMIRYFSNLRRFSSGEDGATGIEFAFVSLAFIAMVLGIFEMGRMLWTLNSIQYASEKAARYAVIETSESESDIQDAAHDAMESMLINAGPATVTTSSVEGTGGITMTEVNIVYPFSMALLYFLPESIRSFNLNAVSRRPEMPE